MAESSAPRYPDARYHLDGPPDLSDRAERERLPGPALKAFFSMMAHWRVRDEHARLLLGGVSNGPYYEMKRDPDRLLDPDRLTRISYPIGIFKALRILHEPRRGARAFRGCLDPDSYVASQTLAERLLQMESLGVVYPSVRHAGGICIACFRPALIANVRRGKTYRLRGAAGRGQG